MSQRTSIENLIKVSPRQAFKIKNEKGVMVLEIHVHCCHLTWTTSGGWEGCSVGRRMYPCLGHGCQKVASLTPWEVM